MTLTAVIMAGGKGERFWPKSRTRLPKQFLNIAGQKSMIQLTVERLEKLLDISKVFIVTNDMYAELLRIQIPHLPVENIIIEPVGRDTAPCIGLASLIIEERYPDSTMVVLPSDHIIDHKEQFANVIETAASWAKKGPYLVTLGITPTYPETGYGYIQSSGQKEEHIGLEIHRVEKFVEKPDKATAEKYLANGNFYWNSGIFVWRTSVIRQYLKELLPPVHDVLETIKSEAKRAGQITEEIIRSEFKKMPSQSIDYGVMEKAKHIFVIPYDYGWDDVGNWTALERLNDTDEQGNVIKGDNIINVDTKNCIIEGNGKLIATLGIEDLIVIDTEDVTLVCTKDKAQDIKKLLKELREHKMDEYL
ncbi:mannose-1-phosphate guanylyltransferase [Marinicrinis lubricantis]|uniref:Mannose-1-phosphate guanylyltransferase n=1 Tax=Marinicrinis lubricantis TaxID=2086470 RepID=A0ABW1IKG6_9BACL